MAGFGALSAACALLPVGELHIAGPQLHVGDVVTLNCAPPSERPALGALVIASVPEGRRTLTRTALRNLIARRTALDVTLGGAGDIALIRPHGAPPARRCYETAAPVAANQSLDRDRVRPVACRTEPGARLDYEASTGRIHADSDLPEGAYLGRLDPPRPAPDTGDQVALVVTAGPVSITRAVTALEPGARSRRIFVRDNDGQVFAAALAKAP
jgi:hypothetical protein